MTEGENPQESPGEGTTTPTPPRETSAPSSLPRFVELMAGTADAGYHYALREGEHYTVRSVIEDALASTPESRRQRSAQEALRREYTRQSGITVEVVDGTTRLVTVADSLDAYAGAFRRGRTGSGKEYDVLKVRVAKRQEGGL
ncbi:MAG: hypothetical protein HYW25_03790 [Candidatus Aenigmarchaeota archaeon]|nr:hypothetical protein [Candidatus Aenigmarchaeota archaeon]